MNTCRICNEYPDECYCRLGLADECGNCGQPIYFIETLAAFLHFGDPEDCCDEVNVDHLVILNQWVADIATVDGAFLFDATVPADDAGPSYPPRTDRLT